MNKYTESVILPHLLALKIIHNKGKRSYKSIYKECIRIVNIKDINYMKTYYITKNLLQMKYKYIIVSINPIKIKKVID